MNTISLVDDKNAFLNYLSQMVSVNDLAKAAIDFLIPLLNARNGSLYINNPFTAKNKLIYQTHAHKPLPMPTPKSCAILYENGQAIIPLMDDQTLLGYMVFEGLQEDQPLQGLEIIKFTLPFLALKMKGLLDKETLEHKLRVINQHQLSYELSPDGYLVDISCALANALGYERHELIGKLPSFLNTHDNDDANVMEAQIFKKDGSQIWVKTDIVPAKDIWGDDSGRKICFQQNISREKQIEEMAIRDDLTKLYNRRFFNQVFAKQIDNAIRNHNYLAFMIIDIDNFKKYNDTYGHQEGDRVLALVAKTIASGYKRKGDYTFRLGGEEFGVICNVTHPEDAEVLANYCRHAVLELAIPHTGNPDFKLVTISTGLVIIDGANLLDANEIYKTADLALYEAKSSGRNCVKVAGQEDDIELF